MADYYSILGIDATADAAEIRSAFKRLALRYHPDRNPGNPEAEEYFKAINEAYHVLSDPLKRARYDGRVSSPPNYANQTETYWKEAQRQYYYQRWRASQENSRYTFDKEYFRIQGLAFLTFLVIAGFCFGIIHIIYFFHDLRMAKIDAANKELVVKVNTLFTSGQVDEAFTMIRKLRDDNPLEYRFYATHDSLFYVVRTNAEQEFNARHYAESLYYLEILQHHESPPRLETLRKLAVCEYQLGDFEKALQSMKQIFNQQPWNLDLLYQIGIIYLENVKDPDQALYYFTLGKRIFKENMSRIYGAAFEIVMLPDDAPEVYYEIFEGRAKANLLQKNYHEAETDCNWAIFLRPQRAEAYKLRVLAKVQQPNSLNICTDLMMAEKLGAENTESLKRKYCR